MRIACAQVAPALQVPLAVRDVHLHRVDRAGRGRGIRSLVGEGHGHLALERGGDEVADLIDGSRSDDDLGRSARGAAGELGEQAREELGVADAGNRPRELQAGEQRRRLARGELGRSLQPDRVGDRR